jgi:NADPH-dependent sulfite reductase flavoprotein alpha-component
MCGVKVIYDPQVEPADEASIKVTPDNDDPFSRGSMCPKAAALGPLHFDPNKLRQPVKKIDGQWQTISWEEAYQLVAEKIKATRDQYGANSIASYLGNPIVHNLGMMLFIKSLTRAIASKNVFSATSMDQLPHHFAAHYMFGHEFRIPVPDIDRTDFMILMGANPIASNGSMMTSAGVRRRLQEIQIHGGKFVVIDPRHTETAKIASDHHFIKPGTDLFFLLAFAHIIFRDKKVSLGRLRDHVSGFDELEPLFREYAPEKVAAITGMNTQLIEDLAKEFLSHSKAVIYGRMGLSTQPHGGLSHWLINTINLITGNLDSEGGMMFPTPAIDLARHSQREIFGRWKSRVRGLNEFAGELPVSAMAEELLQSGEGQVRAFVTICGNPVLSSPGGHRLDQALENIDFMVSIDNYINETTRHADVILPTPSGLEIDHYDLIFNSISVNNNVKFSEAMFPVGDQRPFDWQVLKELGNRIAPKGLSLMDRISTPRRIINLGLMLGPYGRLSSPKRWFTGLSLRKVIDSGHGINLGPLKARVPEGLKTADKKIHLAPDVFLQRLAEVTTEEYPNLLKQQDQLRDNNAFTLIGRRNVSTNNSWMHQVKLLSRSKQVRCTAMINPDDAKALKLFDGEEVKVSSRTGEIILPVELTATMMSGVISIPHGFGHNKKGTRVPIADLKPGVSVNDITDHDRIDKLTGNAAFSGLPITIEKISSQYQQQSLSGKPLTIIFGSQSGNTEMIALELAKASGQHGLLGRVVAMDDVDITTLSEAERLLVVVSTFGEGDMPDNAEMLWKQINTLQSDVFNNRFYAVLGLGDRSYENFCQAGKDWDKKLAELGAERIAPLLECDVDYVENTDRWVDSILSDISAKGDQTKIVHLADEPLLAIRPRRANRHNPMQAVLLDRRALNKTGSSKHNMHYSLSLSDSGETYSVGDAFYIIPHNRAELVEQLITGCGFDGELIYPEQNKTVRQRLTEDLEIRILGQSTLQRIAQCCTNSPLATLLGKPELLAAYLRGKDLLSVLQAHPEVFDAPALDAPELDGRERLLLSLAPMIPRAYSIASSPEKYPTEVHLTVASVDYSLDQRIHKGTCSAYLADEITLDDSISCYVVPNKYFSVPENPDAAMIMVGPGTGIAPFRGFLQERESKNHQGNNWLFFGDRNKDYDYLYSEEIEAMYQKGLLTKLDLAFSRDQQEKVYVQDRMKTQAVALFEWLENGAYFFVCGDAEKMAKDVDKVLHEIIQQQGNMDQQQADEYVEKLKQDKRYIRDVY